MTRFDPPDDGIQTEGVEQEKLEAEVQQRIDEGRCFECGQRDAKFVRFMRVMSFLIITRHREWKAFLCPSCTARTGSKELAISATLGWWGIPWGILTLKAIALNGMSLLRSNLAGRLAILIILGGVGLLVYGIADYSVKRAAEQETERETAEKAGNIVSLGAQRNYQKASELYLAGKPEEALIPLMRAYNAAPRSAAINFLRGEIHHGLGETAKAKTYFERAHEFEPGNPITTYQLATVCGFFDEQERAYRLLGSLMEEPEIPRSVHEEYQGFGLSAGKGEELRAFYKKRREQAGADADAVYLEAKVQRELPLEAMMIKAALVLDPVHEDARCALIHTILTERDYPAAEAECAKLPPASAEQVNRPALSALIALHAGKRKEALKRIDSGMKAGADGIEVRLTRAAILGVLERHDEALAEFDHFLKQCTPGGSDAAYLTMSKIDVLVEKNDLAGAKELLRKRNEAITDSTPWHRMCLTYAEGQIAWHEGDLLAAHKAYASCPDIDFGILSSSGARLAEGILLARLGRPEKARIVWLRLAEKDGPGFRFDPTCLAAKMLLGTMSPEEYRKAVKRESPFYDNNAWFHIGLRHEFAGRKAEAQAAYLAAVQCSMGKDAPAGLARAGLLRVR